MTRLEFVEGKSAKFWEIGIEGKTVTTRWGRLGTIGQSKVETLASPMAARASHDKQLAAKRKKGYSAPGGVRPAAPAAVPTDDQGWLVLADQLSEAGDPRGELISVQHAREKSPKDAKLAAREKKLIADVPLPEAGWVTVGWKLGHFQWVRFENNKDWMDNDFDTLGVARAVFALPHCAGLEELRVGVLRWEHLEHDVPALLKAAAAEPWAPTLKTLRVGDLDDDIDMTHHPVGNLSFLPKAFPGLESLFIHSGTWQPKALVYPKMDFPKLKELTLETCSMSTARLARVLDGRMPALERLSLWFGDRDDLGATATADELDVLLEGKLFPKLRHLGVMNAPFTDDFCERLGRSKLLPRLTSLDLSRGMMGDEGARALARTPKAFAHLEQLDVSHSFLTIDGIHALAVLSCPLVTKGQQTPHPADPDYPDPHNGRYVSVSE